MKVNINIPTELNELTLEQYQKFVKIDTDENKGTTFHLQKLVEIFCDVDLKNLASFKFTDLVDIAGDISSMFAIEHKQKIDVMVTN